ncbi:MAG: DUF3422 domain-containing protein [Pseudomonadota bacterium]
MDETDQPQDPVPSALLPTGNGEPSYGSSPLKFVGERQLLLNEAHARPPVDIPIKSSVTRLMMTAPAGTDGNDPAFEHLQRMCSETSCPVPAKQAKHHVFETGSLRIVWERHTEFYSLTFIRPELGDALFSETALGNVPPQWLAEQPGEVLSATHLVVLPVTVYEDEFEIARKAFGRNDFTASKATNGPVTIASDFRAHADGFTRVLVFDRGTGDGFRGRLVQRLLEIDAYRLAALMALPVARKLTIDLNGLERRLEEIIHRLASKPEMGVDRQLLDDLSEIAGTIEELEQETHFRLSASAAYYRIVLERVDRLREERIDGRQRIGMFMERRLGPAMRTCEATERRLQNLANRTSRAAQLLRTRVNVAVEEGNKSLLESLNKRSEAQLRLQQTVEGLSAVALTYYAVGLVSYMASAAVDAGLDVPKNLIVGLSVPILAALTLLGLKRMRDNLHKG